MNFSNIYKKTKEKISYFSKLRLLLIISYICLLPTLYLAVTSLPLIFDAFLRTAKFHSLYDVSDLFFDFYDSTSKHLFPVFCAFLLLTNIVWIRRTLSNRDISISTALKTLSILLNAILFLITFKHLFSMVNHGGIFIGQGSCMPDEVSHAWSLFSKYFVGFVYALGHLHLAAGDLATKKVKKFIRIFIILVSTSLVGIFAYRTYTYAVCEQTITGFGGGYCIFGDGSTETLLYPLILAASLIGPLTILWLTPSRITSILVTIVFLTFYMWTLQAQLDSAYGRRLAFYAGSLTLVSTIAGVLLKIIRLMR